jgi:hypothetical protein
MSLETFRTVLDFLESLQLPILILSGGEPTNHPEFLTFFEEIAKRKVEYHLTLLSNGTFLNDSTLTQIILSQVTSVQITNDDRFYPEKVPVIEHPKLMYENSIRLVSPFGRALKNQLPITSRYPNCLNFRTLLVNDYTLKGAIYATRKQGRFCTPSINVDGTLVLGETRYCCPVGKLESILSAGLLDKTCASDWKHFPGMHALACVNRYKSRE